MRLSLTLILLLLALLSGQIVKFPQGAQGGITLLDLVIIGLDFVALIALKAKLKSPPLWMKAASVFIIICVTSLILTPLHLNTTQYLTSLAYTLRFFAYLLFGWTIYSGAFPSLYKDAERVLLFSAAGIAGLGLLQLIFLPNLSFLAEWGWDPHYFRTVSTLLDPNFTGAYLALTLVLLTQANLAFLKKNLKRVLFFIVYLALMTTFSRSAAILFLVSFLLLSLLNKSVKLLVLTVILSLGFLLSFSLYYHTIAQPRNIDRQQSAEYRVNSWQQGWQLFTASPILGVGFNSYRFALEQYGLGTESLLQSRGSSANDSSLLFVLATTGIIGFISYLAFLFFIGYQALKTHLAGNKWGRTLLAGLIGLLASSFFINSLFYPFLLIWITLVATKASTNLVQDSRTDL